MQIIVNGNKEIINKPLSLLEFINQKGLNKKRIVVELNLNIIERANLESTTIKEGDCLEIVSFVGGG